MAKNSKTNKAVNEMNETSRNSAKNAEESKNSAKNCGYRELRFQKQQICL